MDNMWKEFIDKKLRGNVNDIIYDQIILYAILQKQKPQLHSLKDYCIETDKLKY